MAIASTHRPAAARGRRVERRSRRRIARATAGSVAGILGWAAVFLALGWLVAAGFYGLLVSA
jgi:hypothetical protein